MFDGGWISQNSLVYHLITPKIYTSQKEINEFFSEHICNDLCGGWNKPYVISNDDQPLFDLPSEHLKLQRQTSVRVWFGFFLSNRIIYIWWTKHVLHLRRSLYFIIILRIVMNIYSMHDSRDFFPQAQVLQVVILVISYTTTLAHYLAQCLLLFILALL
jgi:hypothetical protein